MTTTPLETDFTPGYTHSYWTGGAGWAAQFYFDYYQHTGDKKFLADTGYPFMKEAALFLEDFLTIERNGQLVFNPSYSPENAPLGERNPPACINATVDIAITKQLLGNCIKAATLLKTDSYKIRQWKDMLAKLPGYQISKEGTFREWLWAGEEESNSHRHASHLYALYNDIPAEFRSDSLRKAVAKTIALRMDFHKTKGGTMAFGMSQIGWSAAHIGSASLASEAINWQATNYWSDGMASFHDYRNLFNMDISGGFPYLVSQCLVYSEPGYLKLLPALPGNWKEGSIGGLKLRGNALLQELSWSGRSISLVLHAAERQRVTIELPGTIGTVNGKPYRNKSNGHLYETVLQGGSDIRIVFTY